MKRWGKRIAAIVVCAMMVIGIGPELVTAKGSEPPPLVCTGGFFLTKRMGEA